MIVCLLTVRAAKTTCSLDSSSHSWALPWPGVTSCNLSAQIKWCGTTHLSEIHKQGSLMQMSVCLLLWKELDHLCPYNPIRTGLLFWKGPGSANRKHFSHIKRMTITRRASVTQTEAGHPASYCWIRFSLRKGLQMQDFVLTCLSTWQYVLDLLCMKRVMRSSFFFWFDLIYKFTSLDPECLW